MSTAPASRFNVDTRVLAKVSGDSARCPGVVVQTPYCHKGTTVPYQIRLDDGRLVYAPRDDDSCVMLGTLSAAPVVAPSRAHNTKYDPANLHKVWVADDERITPAYVAFLILQYKEDILNVYQGLLQDFQEQPSAPSMAVITYYNLEKTLVNFSHYMHSIEDNKHLSGTVQSAMDDLYTMNMDMLHLHEILLQRDEETGYKGSELYEFYRHRLCSVGDRGLYMALAALRKGMPED